jgi:polar amino acid transport system substrate-binding protein/glutamate/aspartate transport system substrate-binding protein
MMHDLVKHTSLVLVMVMINLFWMPMAYSEPKASRILKLGVREDAPPFSYRKPDSSEFVGYSVEICVQIGLRAQRQDKFDKFTFVPVTSESRFEDLQNEKVDILCEASTVTLGRIHRYSQTLYTFLSGASFMYPYPIKQSDEQQKLRVGVLKKTTTTENLFHTIWPRMRLDLKNLGFSNVDDFDLVEVENHWKNEEFFNNQEIDLYAADREILIALSRYAKEGSYRVSQRYYSIEPYALFTRRNDVELLHIANTTLRDLYLEKEQTESIKQILRRYFPGQIFSSTLLHLFRLQQLLD